LEKSLSRMSDFIAIPKKSGLVTGGNKEDLNHSHSPLLKELAPGMNRGRGSY
jgi:hypothetical protein